MRERKINEGETMGNNGDYVTHRDLLFKGTQDTVEISDLLKPKDREASLVCKYSP